MANLAIIPARGGSKRIPRKNIKDFLGKPIIAYSIDLALSSGLFDEVMVSTEDNEIIELGLKYGAKIPFKRSQVNSDDYATTIDVIKEVLNQYKVIYDKTFNNICCIYPTAPLTKVNQISEGLKKLEDGNYDTVFPVVEFSYPIFRGLTIDGNGITKMLWPQNLTVRSQDLKKTYHDAGQWYWFKDGVDTLFTENSGSIVLSDLEVQDIDSQLDWSLAEMKYKLLNNIR